MHDVRDYNKSKALQQPITIAVVATVAAIVEAIVAATIVATIAPSIHRVIDFTHWRL